MKENLKTYRKQQHDTAVRAESVRSLFAEDGYTNFFEGVGGIEPVKKLWRQSIQAYQNRTGRMPSDFVLASAHAALERMVDKQQRSGFRATGALFESAAHDMATSEGVLHQPSWAALLMPTILNSSTADMATFVNAKAETTDLLKVVAVAASGSDGVSPGEFLDTDTYGQFATMSRLLRLDPSPMAVVTQPLPDGTITQFKFSTLTLPSGQRPIRPGTIRLRIDNDVMHVDLDQPQYTSTASLYCPPGNAFPSGQAKSYVHVKIDVNYLNGEILVDFTNQPPAAGTRITIEVDLDEEQLPAMIAQLTERCFAAKVHASRYAMRAGSTVQAYWDFRRETGVDLNDTLTNSVTDWLAGEVDLRRLRTALFYCGDFISIDASRRTDDLHLWAESIKSRIIEESDKLQAKNRNVGITGAFAGEKIARLFRSMPASLFEPDSGVSLTSGIRRAGRLFGLIEVYIVPEKACHTLTVGDSGFKPFKTSDVLFYGSDGMGHSPLVAGDGIPATIVNHGTPDSPDPDLRFAATVIGSEICALNPYSGCDYMVHCRFDNLWP